MKIFTCIFLAEAAIALNGYVRNSLTLFLMLIMTITTIVIMLLDLLPKRK